MALWTFYVITGTMVIMYLVDGGITIEREDNDESYHD